MVLWIDHRHSDSGIALDGPVLDVARDRVDEDVAAVRLAVNPYGCSVRRAIRESAGEDSYMGFLNQSNSAVSELVDPWHRLLPLRVFRPAWKVGRRLGHPAACASHGRCPR